MIGKLISKTIKIITLPVDAANSALDLATGGDGSKESRNSLDFPSPFSILEKIRDKTCETAEKIDKE